MSYALHSNTLPTKVLYIDSRDASKYLATQIGADGEPTGQSLNSYFQYILQEPIEVPTNQRCLVSLEGATIPYSFYTVRKFVNDLIPLSFVDDDTGQVGTIDPGFIIKASNYTVYTLANFLQEELPKATGDSNWNSLFQNKFTLDITFNQDTATFTYKMSAKDTSKNWSLYFNFNSPLVSEQDKYANVELGFRFGVHRIQYAGGTAIATECSNVADINGSIHGIYVRTNLVSNGTLDSQTGTFSNILSRLPINVASGGIIFAMPSNNISRSIVDLRSINALTIRLTDERNRILDLNGLHFQLSILIEFVYAEKPVQASQGRELGSSFLPQGDPKARIRAFQQKLAEQEEQRIQDQRRGPGRPRRVGRPREKRPVGRPKGS